MSMLFFFRNSAFNFAFRRTSEENRDPYNCTPLVSSTADAGTRERLSRVPVLIIPGTVTEWDAAVARLGAVSALGWAAAFPSGSQWPCWWRSALL